MKIADHKTRADFDRYDIVSKADLKEAARRQDEYIKRVWEPVPVDTIVTPEPPGTNPLNPCK